ncbi:hypothetical protein NB709_003383 [Xanthomonas sacchari]|nr:hypothetical protein [Xanthomonas sacchari]
MTPRTYWNQYTERHGGPAGVAARLSIPYSTIAGVCNGSRGIGRGLAKRMAESDPELDESILVWVEAERVSDEAMGEQPPRGEAA